MLAHASDGSRADVGAAFAERFGHPLSPTQVSLFRAEHGMQTRRANGHGVTVPVGAERVRKGYVWVKVAERPRVPLSKDNWLPKQVDVWQRTRGLELPRGWVVLFCDHDSRNFDPANLKAVPRSLVGPMNQLCSWHDRRSCEAALAFAALRCGMAAACARPRRCVACGREFVPDVKGMAAAHQVTCRSCLDAGRTSYGRRRGQGRAGGT